MVNIDGYSSKALLDMHNCVTNNMITRKSNELTLCSLVSLSCCHVSIFTYIYIICVHILAITITMMIIMIRIMTIVLVYTPNENWTKLIFIK